MNYGNIKIREDVYLLSSLTKACRLVNDRVKTSLPIHKGILRLILIELKRMYQDQPYLRIMYNALFVTTYFGLFRVGEVTSGTHPIKAHDVQIAGNKSKLRFILRSSKTHGLYNKPQIITIVSTMSSLTKKTATARNSKSSAQWSDICPFVIIQKFY